MSQFSLNSKALSGLVVTSLLLLLTIVMFGILQSWYVNYSEDLIDDDWDISPSEIIIEKFDEGILYVRNLANSNLNITQVKIDGVSFSVDNIISKNNLTMINLSHYSINLSPGITDITLISVQGVFSSTRTLSLDFKYFIFGVNDEFGTSNCSQINASTNLIVNVLATANICQYITTCDGNAQIVTDYPLGTNLGLCHDCDGVGSDRFPADDGACGTIDCDGNDEFRITGTNDVVSVSNCVYDNYTDLNSDRCEAIGDCMDANSSDCTNLTSTTTATAGICEYIGGCTGVTSGSVLDYVVGTDSGLCRECNGAGGEQADSDDGGCGVISCDDWHHQVGSDSVTGTNYCYDSPNIASNRCEGLSDCKDANTADCGSSDDTLEVTCGVCKYVNGCTGTTNGYCSNYALNTDSGLCRVCNGVGGENVPADDGACGTIDCDGLNFYYQSGIDSATATNYCKYRNYVDITTNRCEGLSNCKDANTADCTSYADATTTTAGICRYVSGCSGGTSGTASNYGVGTYCGVGQTCLNGACCAISIPYAIAPDGIKDNYKCIYSQRLSYTDNCGNVYSLQDTNCYAPFDMPEASYPWDTDLIPEIVGATCVISAPNWGAVGTWKAGGAIVATSCGGANHCHAGYGTTKTCGDYGWWWYVTTSCYRKLCRP